MDIIVIHSCPKTSNQMIVYADFCLTNQILLPTPLLMDVKLRRALIGLLVKALATSGFQTSISLIVNRVPS